MESYSLITVIEVFFFLSSLLRQSFCVATAVLELGMSIKLRGMYHHTRPANFNLKEIQYKVIILARNCKSNFSHFYDRDLPWGVEALFHWVGETGPKWRSMTLLQPGLIFLLRHHQQRYFPPASLCLSFCLDFSCCTHI